jgi:hypothetical protein
LDPVYCVLQEQLFALTQIPFPEQEFLSTQVKLLHSFPVHPELQIQFPGDKQTPRPLQTDGSLEFFEKQILS